jgi:hypothetical protein
MIVRGKPYGALPTLAAVVLTIALMASCQSEPAPKSTPSPAGVPLSEAELYETPQPLVTDPDIERESDRLLQEAELSDSCPNSVEWEKAKSRIGKVTTVYGPVAQADYRPDVTGGPTFISLGADYPSKHRVSVVVFEQDRDAFEIDPEDLVRGHTICVSGDLELFQTVPQIQVTTPDQIVVIG